LLPPPRNISWSSLLTASEALLFRTDQ
jgi:hypothetical protein